MVLLLVLPACQLVFPLSDNGVQPDAPMSDGPPPDGRSDGLVLHITFDDPQRLIVDEVDHPVSCSGVCDEQTDDHLGNTEAFSFDGDTTCLTVDPDADLAPPTVTLALWARQLQPPATRQTMIERGMGNDGPDPSFAITSDMNQWSGIVGSAALGNTTRSNGAWHHVGVVYDDADNFLSVYFDGQLQSSAVSVLSYADAPITIGCRSKQGLFAEHFDGALDDVRIYRRALTQQEITELFELR